MIHNLKPYPAYKDSGVSWLGEVPAHWEVRRLKLLLTQPITDGPHLTPQFLESGVPFLSVDGIQQGELVFKDCRYISAEDHAEFSKKAAPRRDDILLGKAASTGKIARVKVDFPFNIWSPLALIRTDLRETQPTFLEYALKDVAAQAQIETFCTLNTQKNISMDDISKLRLALPPLPEQTAIARFLDHADRRIRRYIRAKQKLSALLEEQKQAIIHQAVTRGIDPEVTLKPTGNPWFPKVPVRWDVMPMRRVIMRSADGPHHSPDYLDQGVPFLSARNIKVDRWSLEDVKFISPSDYDTFCQRVKPEVGDVLYTKGGTTGVARAVDLDYPFQVWVHVAVLKPRKARVLPRYLAATLNTPRCYEQSQLFTRGATNQDLGLGRMKEIVLPVPPLSDQADIIERIVAIEEKIGRGIQAARRHIGLLHEYRTRLIADVVTGKLDVREAAAALPEVDPLAVEDTLGDTHAAPEVLPGG